MLNLARDAENRDLKLLEKLSKALFGKWYGEKVQQSIRIVPIE